MSRATTTDIDATRVGDRDALRQRHGVRLVEPAEEGNAVEHLPPGVYGFTYAPAIAAPLFRAFRYRTFEIHRTDDGEVLIVGFLTAEDAARVQQATGPVTITLYHDKQENADALIAVPYSRIVKHRQYSIRNTAGLELEVSPARG